MRSGPHWTGYPPDDPPQGEHWCSECSRWDDECECDQEGGETTMDDQDRKIAEVAKQSLSLLSDLITGLQALQVQIGAMSDKIKARCDSMREALD